MLRSPFEYVYTDGVYGGEFNLNNNNMLYFRLNRINSLSPPSFSTPYTEYLDK